MNSLLGKPMHPRGHTGEGQTGARGFTLIEMLIGLTVLSVGLLGIAGMFSTAYTDVSAGGKTTMALTAAREIVEDMRLLPFDNLVNLNGFGTNNVASQPAGGPERAMGRKWRYALAGDGTGWNFTSAEMQQWSMLTTGGSVVFGGNAVVQVNSPSPTLRQVTVTVPVPGRAVNVSLTTLISRL